MFSEKGAIMNTTNNEFYISRRKRLIREFNRFLKRVRKTMLTHYSESMTDMVIQETHNEFELILKDLPFVGGKKNHFTRIVIVNGWIVAFYRVMKTHGKTAEETVRILCEVAENFFKSVPSFLWRFAGRFASGKMFINRMEKQAAQSQKQIYPEDWVYKTIRSNSYDLEFAMEFSECAVIKLYDQLGVPELKPFCNFFDVISSRYLNLGIDASETLGLGFPRCVMKYKRGRPTKITRTSSRYCPLLRISYTMPMKTFTVEMWMGGVESASRRINFFCFSFEFLWTFHPIYAISFFI